MLGPLGPEGDGPTEGRNSSDVDDVIANAVETTDHNVDHLLTDDVLKQNS